MKMPRLLYVVVALIAIGLVVNSVLVWVALSQISDQSNANATSTKALCVLRDDLQRRVKSSTDFLATHPNGIPGIPAKTIRDGLANQQRTITSLRSLKCPK